MILWEPTNRGFARGVFFDRYDAECSVQDSSLATEPAIWLGCNSGSHAGDSCCARMHVTVPLARELIAVLQRFVETESCGPSDAEPAKATDPQ